MDKKNYENGTIFNVEDLISIFSEIKCEEYKMSSTMKIRNEVYCKKISSCCIFIGKFFNHLFFKYISEHMSLLKDCYDKTVIKSPLNMYNYFSKTYPPSFEFDNKSVVYFWNVDSGKRKKFIPSFTEEQLNEINLLPLKVKPYKIMEYLK